MGRRGRRDAEPPRAALEWLEAACSGDCQVVAIPHNPNLSGGLAFDDFGWTPFTTEMLRLRAWAEPIVEIHQIKGNSECYRGLGTTDEECNFENYYPICEPGQRSGCAHASDYVRNALKTGLRLEADFGVNPFKFGFIASPDDHQSLPGAADEDDFTDKPVKFGTGGGLALIGRDLGWDEKADGGNISNPGGLVGVWAENNTRDAIFDALRRRETFGNSGTRIHVRFFAGWDYPADLDTRRDMLEEAYAGGVAMGSDLPDPPGDDAGDGPRFVVWAMKDPASANLQKVQIVKGWAESDGETAEQVYGRRLRRRVAARSGHPPLRGQRRAGEPVRLQLLRRPGRVPSWARPGPTPDFDAALRAFYYVRVLDEPDLPVGRRTGRWPAAWRRPPPTRRRSRNAPGARRSGTPPPRLNVWNFADCCVSRSSTSCWRAACCSA